MELINLNSSEIFKLIRKEMEEMEKIDTKVLVEQNGFSDYNLIEFEDYKREMTERKLFEFFESKQLSKIYKINVSKIHTYNDLNDLRLVRKNGETIKVYKKNQDYIKYSKEISQQLNEADDLINILTNNKNVKINISFFVNYTQKDIDNIEEGFINVLVDNYKKGFLDCVFNKIKKSDNCVKHIESKIYKNNESNEEYILLEVESLDDYEKDYCDMLKRYNEQEKK